MILCRFVSTARSRRILGILLAAVLCVCAVFLIRAATDPFDCRMAEGVSIGGVEVSGMTKTEARKALQAALEETLYQQPLTVTLPQETLTLSPEDSGVRVRLSKAIRDAYKVGRNESQPSSEIPLLPYLKVDEDQIRALLLDYAARQDTQLQAPSWRLEGEVPALSTDAFDPDAACQTLVVTMGIPSRHLDVDMVCSEILAAYDKAVGLCREGNFSVAPEVPPEAVPEAPDVAAIYEAFCAEPVNDTVDRETYAIVPGAYGYRFDRDALQAQIDSAGYGQTISLPMEYAEPEILGQEAYFQDVLGSCETRHTDNENRNTNLRLLCQALDGVILEPGEEFSFNGVVGERTKEKGYKPAPAYSGNRLVNSYGGGVCQGSTTLYNCVLLADLEVVFRVCHGAKVGYVPLGLDAAVNWATTDFQFRNNFRCPIKIRAEVSDGYVKMQILGTDEKDYYIKMESRSGEDDIAVYARSFKCKYDKETDELISRELEAYSTYYKAIS